MAGSPTVIAPLPGERSAGSRGGWLAWPIALILAAGAAVVVAITLLAVVELHTPLPFRDQWATVYEIGRRHDGDWTASDWFRQHNEHRPLVTRLFFYADYAWFGGQNVLNAVLMPLFQGIQAMLIAGAAWVLARQRPQRWAIAIGAAAVAFALQFSMAQIENFVLGFQVQWASGYTFATAGMAVLAIASTRDRDSASQSLLVLAAILLATMSHLSVANGLFAWVCLLGLAAWLRMSLLQMAALAFAAALVTSLYFAGYNGPEGVPGPDESFERPFRLVRFFFYLLGGPFIPLVDAAIARVLGVLGLACLVALLWDASRHRDRYTAAPSFLLAVAIFAVLTLALISVGRSALGEGAARAERYAQAGCLFWSALVVLGWWAVTARQHAAPGKAIIATTAAGLVLVSALTPLDKLEPWRDYFDGLGPVEDAFRTGVFDSEAMARVAASHQFDDLPGWVTILRAHEYSIFHGRDPSEWMGEPIRSVLVVAQGTCRGSFDAVVNASTGGGYRVVGWAWDPNGDRLADRIVITDANGIVVGLASPGVERPDVPQALPEVTSTKTGWFGYAEAGRGPLRAYALMDEVACPLDGTHGQ